VLSGGPLPIAVEVHARLSSHRQGHHAPDLGAVVRPAAIFTPRALLGVAAKIGAADMVVMTLLGSAHTREEGLRAVRAGAVNTVGDRVIDDLDRVAGAQVAPGR
jgi:hypothetical protein